MTAKVFHLRDYQSSKDRDRIAQMAREIMDQIDTSPCEMISGDFVGIPCGGAGIDGMFQAPSKDPA